MSRLQKIKAELARMLMKFEVIKTDNGVLEYEGELAVDTEVFITDAETEERTPAADGEYVLEDGRTLVVEGGKITEIKEKVEEIEPETTEETEPEQTEEVEAEEVEPETTEETEPETVEETVVEVVEETVDEVAELKGRIDALEALVKELAEKVLGIAQETEEKFSKISLAKPAVEEFENVKSVKKTGDVKVDKFMERYGK